MATTVFTCVLSCLMIYHLFGVDQVCGEELNIKLDQEKDTTIQHLQDARDRTEKNMAWLFPTQTRSSNAVQPLYSFTNVYGSNRLSSDFIGPHSFRSEGFSAEPFQFANLWNIPYVGAGNALQNGHYPRATPYIGILPGAPQTPLDDTVSETQPEQVSSTDPVLRGSNRPCWLSDKDTSDLNLGVCVAKGNCIGTLDLGRICTLSTRPMRHGVCCAKSRPWDHTGNIVGDQLYGHPTKDGVRPAVIRGIGAAENIIFTSIPTSHGLGESLVRQEKSDEEDVVTTYDAPTKLTKSHTSRASAAGQFTRMNEQDYLEMNQKTFSVNDRNSDNDLSLKERFNFGVHPTHPPLPTHPPSHTDSPWWIQSNPITQTPPKIPTTNLWGPTLPPSSVKPPTVAATIPWWTPQVTTPAPVTKRPTPAPSPTYDNPCSILEARDVVTSEKITGGMVAIPHQVPCLAAIYKGYKQFCAGSLIDKTHILTAAHCIASLSRSDVEELRVRLGANSLNTYERSAVDYRVKRIVRHKDYDHIRLYNDLAVLTLDREVSFSPKIRPICLNSGVGSFVGKYGNVSGWGSLYEGGGQMTTLRTVGLQVWSNDQCRQMYGSAAPGGIISSYLCAGEHGRDSCSGDSGGPLIIDSDGVKKQIGMVSWGIGCGKGHYPGVYSRISHFLPWIKRVIAKY